MRFNFFKNGIENQSPESQNEVYKFLIKNQNVRKMILSFCALFFVLAGLAICNYSSDRNSSFFLGIVFLSILLGRSIYWRKNNIKKIEYYSQNKEAFETFKRERKIINYFTSVQLIPVLIISFLILILIFLSKR